MKHGKTFEEAIKDNDVERVRELLRRRLFFFREVNPNDRTRSNEGTPLFDAARRGHLEIVKTLVRSGADPNGSGTFPGYKAIHAAAENGHFEVVEYLLACGVSTRPDKENCRPQDYAEQAGHRDVAELIRGYLTEHSKATTFELILIIAILIFFGVLMLTLWTF